MQIHTTKANSSASNDNVLCSDSYKELVYKHGAVLLQGFPLGDSASFNTFLSHLDGTKQIFYSQGGGVRHAVQEKVKFRC